MNIKFKSEIILAFILCSLMLLNGTTNVGQYLTDYINPQIVTVSLVVVAWMMVSTEIITYLFFSKKETYHFESKLISFKIINKGLGCRDEAVDAFTLRLMILALAVQMGFVLNFYALSVVIAGWSAYNVVQLFKIRKQFAY